MDVVTLNDLAGWTPTRPTYGVLGWPVRHSKSPPMHRAAFEELGLDADYLAFEIPAADLPAAVRTLQRKGVRGLNLTVPHKEIVLPVVDRMVPGARSIGAVNTLVLGPDSCEGHNTDAPGFARAIQETFRAPLADHRVLVLGTGGAGRAVALQAIWDRCPSLTLANRTRTRADSLAHDIAQLLPDRPAPEAISLDPEQLSRALAHADLIVNTSALGLGADDPSPLGSIVPEPRHRVFDTIYNPPLTALLASARQAGAAYANGLAMLLHQGALSFEIWFHRPAPLEAMRRGLMRAAGLPT